MANELSKCYLC